MRDRTEEFSKETWREDYDWQEAFVYAKKIRIAHECQNGPFTISDVEEVIAAVNGENDGPSWVMAGKLKDGRFFVLDAGCDYTGWDCQASGDAAVADSRNNLIRWCMTNEHRDRLGLSQLAT